MTPKGREPADSGSEAGAGSAAADVEIVECQAVTDDLEAAMRRLIGQLSSSRPPPTRAELSEVIASEATTLFLACQRSRQISERPRESGADVDGAEVVGALTLVVFRIPTGVRARIEDVVVDEAVRGRRIGERLSLAALQKARDLGAMNADLTSRPSRAAANRLYRRMGFELRESNAYRFKL